MFDDCFSSEVQALALCWPLSNLLALNFGPLLRSFQLIALPMCYGGCLGGKGKAQQYLKEKVAMLPGEEETKRQGMQYV